MLLDDCLLHMKLVGYSFLTMCFRLTRHENTAVIHASSEDVISITPAGKRMSTAESADLQVGHRRDLRSTLRYKFGYSETPL